MRKRKDWATRMISIHALREEGDDKTYRINIKLLDFYPRPPRGGRPKTLPKHRRHSRFLSTPSARRATLWFMASFVPLLLFLSTPSARRATTAWMQQSDTEIFLSTPSARRATRVHRRHRQHRRISIHALREEGDG